MTTLATRLTFADNDAPTASINGNIVTVEAWIALSDDERMQVKAIAKVQIDHEGYDRLIADDTWGCRSVGTDYEAFITEAEIQTVEVLDYEHEDKTWAEQQAWQWLPSDDEQAQVNDLLSEFIFALEV